eukprot:1157956-Pelagomonas_calceolata.AAC.5
MVPALNLCGMSAWAERKDSAGIKTLQWRADFPQLLTQILMPSVTFFAAQTFFQLKAAWQTPATQGRKRIRLSWIRLSWICLALGVCFDAEGQQ